MNATENQWLLVHQSQPITMTHLKIKPDYETAEVEIDLELSIQEKLTRAIDKEVNSKISSKSKTKKNVTSIVKKRINYICSQRQTYSTEKLSGSASYTSLTWTSANRFLFRLSRCQI
jgi:hypothetical protein